MNRNPLMMNAIALSMMFAGIGNGLQVRPARTNRRVPKTWLRHGSDASIARLQNAKDKRERRRRRNLREAGGA